MMPRPPLLFLTHRIPYPPNKGDKVRSFNILRFLAQHYRVYLATFVDLESDLEHVPALSEWCDDACVERIRPGPARIASLRGLARGQALTLPYYRNGALTRWVRDVVARHGIARAVVFSGAMAQYLDGLKIDRSVIDFCDVDSAKWSQYAAARPWPMSWLYRREGELLGRFERAWAAVAGTSTFVTAAERTLFLERAPELASRVRTMENGVDAEYFSPDRMGRSPYPEGCPTIVFSGAMDYWPNVDAVCWFANDVLPQVRRELPAATLVIVGMNPTPAVRALAALPGVEVTGTVPDVRPYIGHADAVVAPLRVARGIQNKVLEAMSMARPVVVSQAAANGLRGRPGEEFLIAGDERSFAASVLSLLRDGNGRAIGQAARQRVLVEYAWSAHLASLRDWLEGEAPGAHGEMQ